MVRDLIYNQTLTMKKMLFILCSILLFSSCSKDDDRLSNVPPPPSVDKMFLGLTEYVDSFNNSTRVRSSVNLVGEIKRYDTTYEQSLIYTHSCDSLRIWVNRQKGTEDILAGKSPSEGSEIPSNIKDFKKYLIECTSKVALYEVRIKEYRGRHTTPMYSSLCTWRYKVVTGKEYQFEYLSCGGVSIFDKEYKLILVLNPKQLNHPLGFNPEWY